MPRILVTGAGSFIGYNFRKYSRFRDSDEVSLLNTEPSQIDFSGFDVILHLAAIVHDSGKISRENYFRVNKDLAAEVASRAKESGVRHFILMSTVKVYGRYSADSHPWNEGSSCNPEKDYGRSKYEAEQELLKLSDTDFVVSVIRTPVVYGEGVKANILRLIRLVDKIRILPFRDIQNLRYFTFTGNLVAFIDRIIEKETSGIFIAKDDSGVSTTRLVNLIADALDRKVILFRLPLIFLMILKRLIPQLYESLYESLLLDNSETKRLLDFTPPYTSEQGIRNTIEAYKKPEKHPN